MAVDSIKATLKFDYGNLFRKSMVQALFHQGEPFGKIRLHFNEVRGPSQAKILPWILLLIVQVFSETGWSKLTIFDIYRQIKRKNSGSPSGEPEYRGTALAGSGLAASPRKGK